MYNRFLNVSLAAAAIGGCVTVGFDRPRLLELGEYLARSLCPGPPTRVTPVTNLHVPGQIDRIESRGCSQGSSELRVGEFVSDPDGLVMSVEITAPGAGLLSQLEIGRPLDVALRVLGQPERRDGESATYRVSAESESTMTISARAGRITSVQWSLTVD